MTKICKLLIFILIISLFFQTFAVIKTNDFGIPLLTFICIIIALYYKILLNKHIKHFGVISIYILIISIIGYYENNTLIVNSIIRTLMVLFDCCIIYIFMLAIWERYLYNYFVIFMYKFTVVCCIYGIYQFFAPRFGLPYFFNIFQNNPSYNYAKGGLYSYYGGWVDFPRIYATFAEPSFYAIFLVLLIIFFRNKMLNHIARRTVLYILLLTNLTLTFSRSGYGYIALFIVLYMIFKSIGKLKLFYKPIYLIAIMIPFVNLGLMVLLNTYVFKDLSSVGRTTSAIYYAKQIYTDVGGVLFGHGLGSMAETFERVSYLSGVEAFAHNGYIQLLYDNGIILFGILLVLTCKFVNRLDQHAKVVALCTFPLFFCFESVYNVESLVCLVSILFFDFKYYKYVKKTNYIFKWSSKFVSKIPH